MPAEPIIGGPAAAPKQLTIRDYISQEAEKLGIPGSLALAITNTESAGRSNAVSPKGAQGFFQLMPETAADMGVDPSDPFQNIQGGLKYFKQQLDGHGGDVRLALAAYNAGPGRTAGGKVPEIPETQDYVMKVLTRWQQDAAGQATGQAGAPATATSPTPPTPAGPAPTLPPGATQGMLPPDTTTSPQVPNAPSTRSSRAKAFVAGQNADIAANPPPTLTEMFAKPLDPRTPEGRVNDIAIAAGLGTTLLTRNLRAGTGVATAIARVLAPAVAAGAASSLEVLAENAAGTAPPRDPLVEGALQAAYDIGGQVFLWPFRRTARGLVAHKVAVNAAEGLADKKVAAAFTAQADSRAVRDQVAAAARAIKQSTNVTLRQAKRTAGAAITGAKSYASALAADAELATSTALKSAQGMYDNLLRQAPSKLGGKVVADVLEGPAARALNAVGQSVAAAAKTGPPIPFQPVKDIVNRLAEQWRPAEIFTPVGDSVLSSGTPMPNVVGAASAPFGRGAMSMEQYTQLVQDFLKARSGRNGIPADIPQLQGLLGKIQDVQADTIPFDVAHTLKRLLDESVNWDLPARTANKQMTKAARTALRATMADMGHEPYETATRTYHGLIPVYRKGVGDKLAKLANAPDGMAKMATVLKSGDPAEALTLKQLLVAQSAEGGDPGMGQRAWDLVRSNYTYDKILTGKGGIDGLSERLLRHTEGRNKEFTRVVFGDPTGATILTNLGKIADAYAQAKAFEATERVSAKAAGAKAVAAARTASSNLLDQTRTGVEATRAADATAGTQKIRGVADTGRAAQQAVTDEAKRFSKSSVAKFVNRTAESEATDAAQAALLTPHGSYWGIRAVLRLLRAPSGGDLLTWASYSSKNTQRLVNAISAPGLDATAMSAFLRDISGVINAPTEPTDDQSTTTTPASTSPVTARTP